MCSSQHQAISETVKSSYVWRFITTDRDYLASQDHNSIIDALFSGDDLPDGVGNDGMLLPLRPGFY